MLHLGIVWCCWQYFLPLIASTFFPQTSSDTLSSVEAKGQLMMSFSSRIILKCWSPGLLTFAWKVLVDFYCSACFTCWKENNFSRCAFFCQNTQNNKGCILIFEIPFILIFRCNRVWHHIMLSLLWIVLIRQVMWS